MKSNKAILISLLLVFIALFAVFVYGLAPTISVDAVSPTSGIFRYSASAVDFNFTATNNYSVIYECNLTINDVYNATLKQSVLNNTNVSFTVTGFEEGIYNWNVTCWDNLSNQGSSSMYTFTNDLSAPAPNLNTSKNIPDGYTIYETSGSDFGFNFTPIDNYFDTIANCSLMINAALNESTINIANNTETMLMTRITQGSYAWNITCTDNVSNSLTSSTLTFTHVIDSEAPVVTPTPSEFPADGANFSSTSKFDFNFTPTDNIFDPILNCSLLVNGVVNQTLTSLTNNTKYHFNTTFGQGTHTWYVKCADNLSNSGQSSAYSFTNDFIAPAPGVETGDRPRNGEVYYGIGVTIFDFSFNFTPTENHFDDIASCTMMYDGATNETTTNIVNNTKTKFETPITAGTHYWNITCVDDLSNSQISSNYVFTYVIDTTAPLPGVIAANSPTNGQVYYGIAPQTFDFNFTPTDNVFDTIAVCTLNINGTANETSSDIVNYTNTQYSPTLVAGAYSWNITCADNLSNTGSSINRVFNYVEDAAGPVVVPTPTEFPADGANFSSTAKFDFNFTPTDAVFNTIKECNFTVNGIFNQTLTWLTSGSKYHFNTTFGQGTYTWQVICADNLSNTGQSSAYSFTNDFIAPVPGVITADSPTDTATYIGNAAREFDFNFTPTENHFDDIASCTMMLNGATNETATDIVNETKTKFTTLIGAGTYNWNITCVDDLSNSQTSSTLNFTYVVDSSLPVVTPDQYPADGGNFSTLASVDFNFTPTDNSAIISNCSLFMNGVVNNSLINLTNNTQYNFNTTFGQGTFTWYVKCADNLTNEGQSTAMSFTNDFIAPLPGVVTANSPGDGQAYYSTAARTFAFNFTPIENHFDDIASCTLNINGTSNTSSTNIVNYTNTQYSPTFTAGAYSWNITCTDDLSNAGSSTNYAFTLAYDTTAPVIIIETANSPAEGANLSASVYDFNFTPSDATFDTIASCNLTLNGVLNKTLTDIENGSETNFTIPNLPDGTYAWGISCQDNLSNTASSITYNFTSDVTSPVVSITSPTLGQNVSNSYITLTFNVTEVNNITNFCWYNLTGSTIGATVTSSDVTWDGNEATFTTVLYDVPNGDHDLTVNCTDLVSSTGQDAIVNITINDNETAPLISALNRTYDGQQTTQVNVNVTFTTNEYASCRYATTDVAYASMTAIVTTGTTSHFNQINYTADSTGTYYFRCNDSAGNVMNVSNSTAYDADYTAAAVTPTGSSGGGAIDIPKEVLTITYIASGSSGKFELSEENLALSIVTIKAKVTLSNVGLSIIETIKPFGSMVPISDTRGKIFQYMAISPDNFDQDDVDEIKFNFKVPISWFEDNGLSPNKVKMMHYVDNEWVELVTKRIGSDADNYLFDAVTPWFSTFVITAEIGSTTPTALVQPVTGVVEPEEPEVVEPTTEPEVIGEEDVNPPAREPIKVNWIDLAIIVVVLVLLALMIYLILPFFQSKGGKPKKRKKMKEKKIKKPKVHKPLDKYVKDAKKKGYKKNIVKKRLKESGWKDDIADHHLERHYKK